MTSRIHRQISSGTYDAPSWDLVRCAKLAAQIYAPLGTSMALGDYVRVSRAFLEAFKWANVEGKVENGAGAGTATTSGSDEEDEEVMKRRRAQVNALLRDLKVRKLGISPFSCTHASVRIRNTKRPSPRSASKTTASGASTLPQSSYTASSYASS